VNDGEGAWRASAVGMCGSLGILMNRSLIWEDGVELFVILQVNAIIIV
jgi:hypothetical protein